MVDFNLLHGKGRKIWATKALTISHSTMWDPMHSLAKLTLQGTCLGFTQVCPSAAEGVEEKNSYNRRKQLVSLTTPKLR